MGHSADFATHSVTAHAETPSVSSRSHPSDALQLQGLSQTSQSSEVSVNRPGELINIDVLAKRLGCSSRHIRRLVDSGRIPRPIKLGALLRWIRADIDQWIAAGCPTCRKGGDRNGL
jgi:excisionase family DNA binding protein